MGKCCAELLCIHVRRQHCHSSWQKELFQGTQFLPPYCIKMRVSVHGKFLVQEGGDVVVNRALGVGQMISAQYLE